MPKKIDLTTLANGAVREQIDKELQKVIDNIYDPNTDATKKRRLSLIIELKPTKTRNMASVEVQAKATLAPIMPSATTIIIEKNFETGEIQAAEIGSQIPGQIEMDLSEAQEKAPEGNNIIDLRQVSK